MTKPVGFVQSGLPQKNQPLRPNTVIPKVALTKKTKNNDSDSDYDADNEQDKRFKRSQSEGSSQLNQSSEASENTQLSNLSTDNNTQQKKRKHLHIDTSSSIIQEISSAFIKSLNVLEEISKLAESSEEETTGQETSDSNPKRFVRFLKPINQEDVDYKIYIKGLSSQSGTRYGVSIRRLESASKERKSWTNLMKNSDKEISFPQSKDKYYIHQAEVTGHYSHALPNCFYGTETPANVAYTTRANFSSRFMGQGDAQGIIEETLRDIYQNKVGVDAKLKGYNQKTPDLRWKSSDAFSEDGQLMYRRIKIYASDTYGAIKKSDGKYNYAETMLGEFFLPGHLAVSANSDLIKELKAKVSIMKNNFNDLLRVYENNISNERDARFWERNDFTARDIEFDGVKKHRSHQTVSSDSFPQEYYDFIEKLNPVELQDEISSIAKKQKQNRDDTLLSPSIIQVSEKNLNDVIDDICIKLKETDIDTLENLRTKHQTFFSELVSELDETTQSESEVRTKLDNNKVPINVDTKNLENCYHFYSDLISEKLVDNRQIKVLASKMMLPNKGNSLYVNHTPITAWIFAILRIAKKII